MNAKNDIIQDLNQQVGCYQEECRQLREEICDGVKLVQELNCEIIQLRERNDLQHSSWMLCDECHKDEVKKLKAEIKDLGVYLDGSLALAHNLKTTRDRIHGWNFFQSLVARVFRL